jgi:RNA polymerase sigma-70 factor (ECF subfamily)
MTSHSLTAEDITQNVFLKLFENYNSINDKNKIDIWVFKTAKFEAFNYYRGKKTKVDQFKVADTDELEIGSDFDVLEIIEMKDLKEKIESELENIPIEQKEVFVLKEFGGLRYEEISDIIGIDEKLVKSRIHLARKKLMLKLSKVFK